ncbi:MAG: NFACT family protein [Acidobacteriota bacterium]
MAIEDYLLEQIVAEAAPLIINQNVGRVFAPALWELAIYIRRPDHICLYISLLPARPGLFLTSRSIKTLEGERNISNFVELLRKYLSGTTLSAIEKERGERRLRIDFAGFDAAGLPRTLSLLVELTGRSANAHLFVGSAYLASLRDLPSNSSAPIALTAFNSQPLSNTSGRARDICAATLDQRSFAELVTAAGLEAAARRLAGFSPTLVRELVARAARQQPYQALQSLLADLDCRTGQARIYAPSPLAELLPGTVDPRRNLLLSYFPLVIAIDLVEERFTSLNAAADQYFLILARVEAFQTRRQTILAKLKAELNRLETVQKKLADELIEFRRADEYAHIGNLILANLATLRREEDHIVLIDYFHTDQPEISIPVETNLSPQQMAESYFKRYQRARRGLQAVMKRMQEVERELASKRQLSATANAALNEEALAKIEMVVTPTPQTAQKSSSQTLPRVKKGSVINLRRYLSTDGYEIFVGRSDASNEQLTFQIAKPADIWLHAADYPGPHVLIRNPERRAIPTRTLIEAAQLAAFFSKARGETTAAIRYTERKNVTRPKNAKPGLVLLTKFKSIQVTPREAGQRLL